ncbi:MAG: hypothetical protein Kow00107_00800 [Planctomycetota bacterium]
MIRFDYQANGDGAGGSNSERSRREELADIAEGLAQQLKEDKVLEKKAEERAKKESRRFPWRITVLCVVMALLLAYYFVWPPVWPTKPRPITIGYPAQWSSQLEDAVNVLWKYREAIDRYLYLNKGEYPKSFEDLLEINPALPKECPGNREPFVFKSTPEDKLRIEAPSPKELGVRALYLSSKFAPPKIEP